MQPAPPSDRHLAWRVDGQPVPQKRHRHTHAGRVYDPSTVAKRDFLAATRAACPGLVPLEGPLVAHLEFQFARPKSHYRKHGALRKGAPSHHTQTPDVDNLIKFVFDAINGHIFHDDKQVVAVHAKKTWSASGSTLVSVVPSDPASPPGLVETPGGTTSSAVPVSTQTDSGSFAAESF